jgi:hypothetical protein
MSMRRFGREFQSIRLPRNGCRTYSRGLTTPTAQWLAKKPVCPRERGEESRAGRGAPMLSFICTDTSNPCNCDLAQRTCCLILAALGAARTPQTLQPDYHTRLRCSVRRCRGSRRCKRRRLPGSDSIPRPRRSIISVRHSSWLDAAFHVKTSSSLDCCNEISSSPASAWPDEAKRKLE